MVRVNTEHNGKFVFSTGRDFGGVELWRDGTKGLPYGRLSNVLLKCLRRPACVCWQAGKLASQHNVRVPYHEMRIQMANLSCVMRLPARLVLCLDRTFAYFPVLLVPLSSVQSSSLY
jgi:hypothetical protein